MEDFSIFINDSIAESAWTPDVPVVESQDHWYVFVYGSKRGKSSAYFTYNDSDAEFIGIGWTKSSVYSILNIQDGKSEYQLADVLGTERILGEVWKIPTEMLYDLDSDELNQLVTRRLPIPVVVNGRIDISAWIYTTDRKYLLNGGLRISKHTGCTYYGDQKFLEIH